MLWILVVMLGILAVAGLVVLYVAFPHRGEDVPAAPWVGDALRKGVDLLPTLDDPDVASRRDERAARARR